MSKYFLLDLTLFLNRARRNRAAPFVIRLCLDMFLEVLRSGTRRQLAGLEKIGGRFRLVIDGYFGEKPFLRLELALRPRYSDSVPYFFKNFLFIDILLKSN